MTPDEAAALARMRAAVDHLERVGENDMGFVTERQAGRWHTATEKLRAIIIELEARP